MAASFEIGDLVWAKMKGYPFWPARIWDPTNAPKPPKTNKAQHYVSFFGDHTYAWILEEFIVPHSDEMLDKAKAYKKLPTKMQEGIVQIETITKKKMEPSNLNFLQLANTSRYPNVRTRSYKRKIGFNLAEPIWSEEDSLQLVTTYRKTKVAKRPSKKKPAGIEKGAVVPLMMKGSQNVPKIKVEQSEENSLQQEIASITTTVAQKPPWKKIKMDSKALVLPSVVALSENPKVTKMKKKTDPKIKLESHEENSVQLKATSENPMVPKRSSKRRKKTDSKVKMEPSEENLLQLEAASGNPNVPKWKKKTDPKIKMAPSDESSQLEAISGIPKESKRKEETGIERNIEPSDSLNQSSDSNYSLDEEISKAMKTLSYQLLKSGVPSHYAIIRDHLSPEDILAFSNSTLSADSVQPDFDPSTTPEVELSPNIRERMISPFSTKIGFIGLGMIGTEIVRRLLQTGHDVTIWNRTPQKCIEFFEKGVVVAATPADVIRMCGITFCCVANSEASREIFYGVNGVLKGLTNPYEQQSGFKGYVEMSSIDPETSIEIGNAFCEAGGVYLEAPLLGSRQNVKNRGLQIISAGDSALFRSCETCFAAVTRHAFKVSTEVGTAAKLNLVLCTLTGSALVALNEAMNMLQTLNLNRLLFLCCVGLTDQCSSFILDKGFSMITKNPTVHIPLKTVQRNMDMALSLTEDRKFSLRVAAAANETLRHAAERFPEHDITALRLSSYI